MLKYVRYYGTNIGAVARTQCWLGKHTQGRAAGPLLVLYGGDGDWRFEEMNFAQNQSLNSVCVYDFRPGADGKLTRPRGQLGDPADGTAPFYHDGATWVWNSVECKFYAIPGYQPGFGSNQTVQTPYSHRLVVHRFNMDPPRWEKGPPSVGWPGEHWGGAYDSKRNRIWICTRGTGSHGAVKWYSCPDGPIGTQNMRQNPDIPSVPNLGYDLDLDNWPQAYNPATDELLCYDGRRGFIYAIALTGPGFKPRIVASVPAIKSGLPDEPTETVEMGFAISVKRQKAFLTCSRNYYLAGGALSGVWTIDLATGETDRADYPAEAGGNEHCQYTACEYIDDPEVDALVMWDNIVDASRVWGHRFLMYKFDEGAPVPTTPPDITDVSLTINANIAGADNVTLNGAAATLPVTIPVSADSSYELKATNTVGETAITVAVNMPPVVTYETEQRDQPCAEGYTGSRTEKRTVTLHDGVPVAWSEWVEVSSSCVLIPPSTYPNWRAGKAIMEWVMLAGTGWAYRNKDYFATKGLLIPAQRPQPKTNYMHWGTNKLGQTCIRGLNDKYTSENYGYHGMAFDDRDSTIYVGGGDAEYPENSYFKLKLESDALTWQMAVQGSHSSEYKHSTVADGSQFSNDGGLYQRRSEHMDGRPRGGHKYWNQEFLKNYQGADRIVEWASNQFYDTDSSNDSRVRTANLQTMEYEQGQSQIIKTLDWPIGSGTIYAEPQDTNPSKAQHPLTQDQYMFRGDSLFRWNFATNTYDRVFNFQPMWGQNGVHKLSLAINPIDNYILCEGNVGPAHATRATGIIDLNTPQGTNLATYIPITVAGPAAAKWNVSKYGAVMWCPDLQKFLQYKNDVENKVYSITRTGTAEVTVDEVLTTGQMPPASMVGSGPGGGLGGMLNKWRYAPNLHGMVCMLRTRDPIYFLVTKA